MIDDINYVMNIVVEMHYCLLCYTVKGCLAWLLDEFSMCCEIYAVWMLSEWMLWGIAHVCIINVGMWMHWIVVAWCINVWILFIMWICDKLKAGLT